MALGGWGLGVQGEALGGEGFGRGRLWKGEALGGGALGGEGCGRGEAREVKEVGGWRRVSAA